MTTLANNVEICNFALTALLGKPGLSSLTQSSTEAQRCSVFYPIAAEEIAQESNWTFLRERTALAEVANDKAESWDKAYDYPSRALKLFYLFEPSRPRTPVKDYRQINGVIYTNLGQAYAHYVTLEGKPISTWSLHFKLAIAAKVASYLAPSMTRRPSDVNAFREMAAQHVAKAIEVDASTEHETYTEDESYVYGVEGNMARQNNPDGSTFWDY